MKPACLGSKDLWGGLLLIATGGLAVFIAGDYPFGTVMRMGAGFFPIVLGGILVLFGLYLAVRGLRSAARIEGGWPLRPLLLLPLALVLFGLLMDRAGLVPALAVLIFASAAAGREFRLFEVVALAVVLTAFSVAVFVWGLGQPYPLFAGR